MPVWSFANIANTNLQARDLFGCYKVVVAIVIWVGVFGNGNVPTSTLAQETLQPALKTLAPVTALAFSPSDDQLFCGSTEGLQQLTWPELKLISKLPVDLAAVYDLRFSATGDSLLVAGGTPGELGAVEVWDYRSGTRMHTWQLHEDTIHQVAWSASGKEFATAGFDGLSLVFDLETQTVTQKFSGHSKGVLTVQTWNNHTWLSGGLDHTIRLWKASDASIVRTLDNHVGHVVQIIAEPSDTPTQNRRALSISSDRTIRLWQPEIGRLVRFARLPAPPTCAVWHPDEHAIFVGCQNGGIFHLNDQTLNIECQLTQPLGMVNKLLWHAPTKQIVIAAKQGVYRLELDSDLR